MWGQQPDMGSETFVRARRAVPAGPPRPACTPPRSGCQFAPSPTGLHISPAPKLSSRGTHRCMCRRSCRPARPPAQRPPPRRCRPSALPREVAAGAAEQARQTTWQTLTAASKRHSLVVIRHGALRPGPWHRLIRLLCCITTGTAASRPRQPLALPNARALLVHLLPCSSQEAMVKWAGLPARAALRPEPLTTLRRALGLAGRTRSG